MDFTAPEKARDASLLLPDTPYESNAFEDLIYLISHDVRNSMRAVIELLQWIAEGLAQAGVKLKRLCRGKHRIDEHGYRTLGPHACRSADFLQNRAHAGSD